MSDIYDVPYMLRTRDYYRAQGYTKDYVWAENSETPFTPLAKPLNECQVGVVVTAMPDTESGRANRKVYASLSSPVPNSMYTAELSWHQTVTHTEDVGSFLPLRQLNTLVDEGVIGSVAQRFYSAPTEYSQRNTREKDAPEILARCCEDEVDIAILVPL